MLTTAELNYLESLPKRLMTIADTEDRIVDELKALNCNLAKMVALLEERLI